MSELLITNKQLLTSESESFRLAVVAELIKGDHCPNMDSHGVCLLAASIRQQLDQTEITQVVGKIKQIAARIEIPSLATDQHGFVESIVSNNSNCYAVRHVEPEMVTNLAVTRFRQGRPVDVPLGKRQCCASRVNISALE